MQDDAYGAVLFYYNNDPNKPIRKLFIDRVLQEFIQITPHGCYMWLGSLGGYGQPQMNVTYFVNKSGNVSVPRLMFQYMNGSINRCSHVYRKCFTEKCVNPLHFVQKENNINGS